MDNLDVVCADPDRYTHLIGVSKNLVDRGASAAKVSAALCCIAQHEGMAPFSAGLALRAAFHLAPDDAARRSLLLQVIRSDSAEGSVVLSAFARLVYVADEDSRSALLTIVREDSPSEHAKYALDALVDLGEERVLAWLAQQREGLGDQDFFAEYWDTRTARIEIQKDVPEMLRQIGAPDTELDREWLVRQAIRHGAPGNDVRQRVLVYARRRRAEAPPQARALRGQVFPGMVAAQQCRLFTPEDANEFEGIRGMEEARYSYEFELPWATMGKAKYLQFYCGKTP